MPDRVLHSPSAEFPVGADYHGSMVGRDSGRIEVLSGKVDGILLGGDIFPLSALERLAQRAAPVSQAPA
jgi:hypothetical protein